MPTTTDRAACVNSNEILSDALPSSLTQLHVAVMLYAHVDTGKTEKTFSAAKQLPSAEPRIILMPLHASGVQVQGVEV